MAAHTRSSQAEDAGDQPAASVPSPVDTRGVVLPPELHALIEMLAENTHNVWAQKRLADGWRYGPQRDDANKTTPNLVTYARLPESEKEYDRRTATEVLKVIVTQGYRLEAPERKAKRG